MKTTTLDYSASSLYAPAAAKPSALARFSAWCNGQERNRLLWTGLALGGHGCVITPATLVTVFLAGNSLPMFMLAMTAMGMALVANLAALPTRITIPVFILSLLIDLGIVIASVATGFNTNIIA